MALISAEIWRSRYGAAPDILGRPITLNEQQFQIVGVMPEGMRIPGIADSPHVWIPLGSDPVLAQLRELFPEKWERSVYLTVWSRLQPGIALPAAQSVIGRGSVALLRDDDSGYSEEFDFRVVPVERRVSEPFRVQSQLLLAAALLALLTGYGNAANLLLVRTLSQRADLAIRRALGESASEATIRLVAQHAIVCSVGAGVGILAAPVALRALLNRLPDGVVPFRDLRFAPDAILSMAVSAVVLGLIVALVVSQSVVGSREASALVVSRRVPATPGTTLLRRSIVACQVGVAVTALLLAIALYTTYRAAESARTLDDWDRVLVADVTLPKGRGQGDRWKRLANALGAELRAVNGVSNVSVALAAPGTRVLRTSYEVVERSDLDTLPIADYVPVGPSYFTILRMPLREGRWISEADGIGSERVCAINDVLARRTFGTGRAIGASIRRSGGETCQVVGIVSDVVTSGPGESPRPAIYVPFDQMPSEAIQGFLAILVRMHPGLSSGEERHMRNALTTTVRRAVPDLPVAVRSLRAVIRDQSAGERFRAGTMTTISGLAVLLAILGVYAVAAEYAASQRRTLMIKLAVGATPRRLALGVAADTARVAVVGLLVGVGVAYAAAELLTLGLDPAGIFNASSMAIVACVVTLITVGASSIPSRRIVLLNPRDLVRQP